MTPNMSLHDSLLPALQPRCVASIGLGSNLGDRLGNLQAALVGLARLGEIVAVSSAYETAPVGYEEQPAFLNAAAQLATTLTPEELLRELLAIERSQGRDRSLQAVPPQGPRTLDLDLLLYADQTLATEQLTVPHPALHQRRFVLAPLAEIAPALQHPVLRHSMQELLEVLPDTGANRRAAVQCLGRDWPSRQLPPFAENAKGGAPGVL